MKKCKRFTGIDCQNNHETMRTATVVIVGVVMVFLVTVLAVVMGGVK